MGVVKDQLNKMTLNQVQLQEQLNQSNELAKKVPMFVVININLNF